MAKGDNQAIAYYDPGTDISAFCEAAVTGMRFVKISDPKKVASQALSSTADGGNIVVSPCGANERAFGVASYDSPIGDWCPIMRGHKVVPVTSGAALTAGDLVVSDATGRAVPYDAPALSGDAEDLPAVPFVCGQVLNSPTAAGQTAIVALDL